jgi:hypothetical protein
MPKWKRLLKWGDFLKWNLIKKIEGEVFIKKRDMRQVGSGSAGDVQKKYCLSWLCP